MPARKVFLSGILFDAWKLFNYANNGFLAQ